MDIIKTFTNKSSIRRVLLRILEYSINERPLLEIIFSDNRGGMTIRGCLLQKTRSRKTRSRIRSKPKFSFMDTLNRGIFYINIDNIISIGIYELRAINFLKRN